MPAQRFQNEPDGGEPLVGHAGRHAVERKPGLDDERTVAQLDRCRVVLLPKGIRVGDHARQFRSRHGGDSTPRALARAKFVVRIPPVRGYSDRR